VPSLSGPNDWGIMGRMAFLLIAALVLALSAAPAALAQDADKDCADFSSQAEAQAYFEANAGSPTNNVDNLDADHDGQACEAFDYGGGGTGGGGTGGDDGDLPFTGPNDTLLPAGTALLLAGLALVGITRYRARHARR
jgi:Excalibur calcium-binding domain